MEGPGSSNVVSRKRFGQFAWALLIYDLATILWGATVRATGSGDGCGSNWPACGNDGGALFPHGGKVATLIEHTHRFTSELIGLLVVVLVVWGFRAFPQSHPVRRNALLTLFFVTTEALLGAYLVKHGLVAHNQSPERAVWMSLHLVNTLLLTGAITLTAWQSLNPQPIRWRGSGMAGIALAVGLVLTLILCVSGAISALGGTLFPVTSLAEGLRLDLSPTSHALIRLRFWHPFIALSVFVYALTLTGIVARARPQAHTAPFQHLLAILFASELVLGLTNLLLHAPLLMQLVHLLFADLVWIGMVLLTASALAEPQTAAATLPQREAKPMQSGAIVGL